MAPPRRCPLTVSKLSSHLYVTAWCVRARVRAGGKAYTAEERKDRNLVKAGQEGKSTKELKRDGGAGAGWCWALDCGSGAATITTTTAASTSTA